MAWAAAPCRDRPDRCTASSRPCLRRQRARGDRRSSSSCRRCSKFLRRAQGSCRPSRHPLAPLQSSRHKRLPLGQTREQRAGPAEARKNRRGGARTSLQADTVPRPTFSRWRAPPRLTQRSRVAPRTRHHSIPTPRDTRLPSRRTSTRDLLMVTMRNRGRHSLRRRKRLLWTQARSARDVTDHRFRRPRASRSRAAFAGRQTLRGARRAGRPNRDSLTRR